MRTLPLGLAIAAIFFVPSLGRCEDPKPAEINAVRLYVPTPQMEDRFGKDIDPLVKYIKALEKGLGEVMAKEKQPEAKGLLIAIGIKSKKQTRIWCEAVEGDAPAEMMAKLEKELSALEGVDLKKSPAGFAFEVKLFGQKPDKYPEFPAAWIEGVKKTESKLLMPPDELFKVIWPDVAK